MASAVSWLVLWYYFVVFCASLWPYCFSVLDRHRGNRRAYPLPLRFLQQTTLRWHSQSRHGHHVPELRGDDYRASRGIRRIACDRRDAAIPHQCRCHRVRSARVYRGSRRAGTSQTRRAGRRASTHRPSGCRRSRCSRYAASDCAPTSFAFTKITRQPAAEPDSATNRAATATTPVGLTNTTTHAAGDRPTATRRGAITATTATTTRGRA